MQDQDLNMLKDIIFKGWPETKCLLLARESVFWPGITNDIKQLVKDCDICNKY